MERRTVRIAVSLAVLVSCCLGLLAVFYIRNSTYGYASEESRNRSTGTKLGAYGKDDDYKKALLADVAAFRSEQFLSEAHRLAIENGLMTPSDGGVSNLPGFLDGVSRIEIGNKPTGLSEKDYDQYAVEMQQVVREVVDYANSLNIVQRYDEKKRALLAASKISTSLDCRYSFEAYMSRVYSSLSVLNELSALQKSDVSTSLKKPIIDVCMDELKKPLRTAEMLKKEQLRLLNNFDITLGLRLVKSNSINYRKPEDFPLYVKWVQKLPQVESALRSRVYEAFALPLDHIYRIKESYRTSHKQDYESGVDPGALSIFSDRVKRNKASSDLIFHFAPELLDRSKLRALSQMEAEIRRILSSPIVQ